MKVYFISGLGADQRVFKYIRLTEGNEIVFVNWIPPLSREALPDYAMRLSQQIDTREPFILAGMSLGGIMSVEIAKQFPPVCTILIGSVPLSSQMPLHFKLAQQLNLVSIVPPSFYKWAALVKRYLGREPAEDRKIISQMIREGDNKFIKWAMQAVLEWKNDEIPQPLWHIHGTKDEVFPISLTNPTHIIPKGSHVLVITHPEEINKFLKEVIEKSIADANSFCQ